MTPKERAEKLVGLEWLTIEKHWIVTIPNNPAECLLADEVSSKEHGLNCVEKVRAFFEQEIREAVHETIERAAKIIDKWEYRPQTTLMAKAIRRLKK